jgi:hypothetical protein
MVGINSELHGLKSFLFNKKIYFSSIQEVNTITKEKKDNILSYFICQMLNTGPATPVEVFSYNFRHSSHQSLPIFHWTYTPFTKKHLSWTSINSKRLKRWVIFSCITSFSNIYVVHFLREPGLKRCTN